MYRLAVRVRQLREAEEESRHALLSESHNAGVPASGSEVEIKWPGADGAVTDTVICKGQLIISAKDNFEQFGEAGLHHLERLASDQTEFVELPECMPIPLSAWWSGWWTVHGLLFSIALNIYRGITGK